MKKKIVSFCAILVAILSFNCSQYDDQKEELRKNKIIEVEKFLQLFTEKHQLHTMRQGNDQRSSLYTYFGFFSGKVVENQELEYNITFSWKHPCNNSYIFSSVPLSRTRVMITQDSLPLIQFKMKPGALGTIVNTCIDTRSEFKPGKDLISVEDHFDESVKRFIEEYVENLTITCRPEQWPTNITMPN